MEAWRRLDPRVSYVDIAMRQMPEQGIRRRTRDHDTKRLASMIDRHREAFCILDWYSNRGAKAHLAEKLCEKVSLEQLQKNSTRGITPGLIDPKKGDVKENRIPLPETDNARQLLKRAPVAGPEAPDPRLIHQPTGYHRAVPRKYVFAPVNWKQVQRTPSPPSSQNQQNQEDGGRDQAPGPDFASSDMDVDPSEACAERLLEKTLTVPMSGLPSRPKSVSDDEDAQIDDEEAVLASQSEYDEDSEEDELAVLDEMIREATRLERGRSSARGSQPFETRESADEDMDENLHEDISESELGSNSSTPNYLDCLQTRITNPKTGRSRFVSRPSDEQQLKVLKALIRKEARAEQICRVGQDVTSDQPQSSSHQVMETDCLESPMEHMSKISDADSLVDATQPSDEQQLDELNTLIHEADIAEKGRNYARDSASIEPPELPSQHKESYKRAKDAEPPYVDISDSSLSKASNNSNYNPDLASPRDAAKKAQEDIGTASGHEPLNPYKQLVEDLPESAQIFNPDNSTINPWTNRPWTKSRWAKGSQFEGLIYALPVPQAPKEPLIETIKTASNGDKGKRKRTRTRSANLLRASISFSQEAEDLEIDQPQDASNRASTEQESGSRYNLRQRGNNGKKRTIVSFSSPSSSESGSEFEAPQRPERRFVMEAIKAKREAQQAAKKNRRLATAKESDVSTTNTDNSDKSDSDVVDHGPAIKRTKQDCAVPVGASSRGPSPTRSVDLCNDVSRSRSFDIPEDAMGVELVPLGLPFAGLSEPNHEDIPMVDIDKVDSGDIASGQVDSQQANSAPTPSTQVQGRGHESTGVVPPGDLVNAIRNGGSPFPFILSNQVNSHQIGTNSGGEKPALALSAPSASTAQSGNFMDMLVEEVIELRSRVASLPPEEHPSGEPLGRRVDRVAKMVMDLRAGSERLLDEVASLRGVVDGYDKRW